MSGAISIAFLYESATGHNQHRRTYIYSHAGQRSCTPTAYITFSRSSNHIPHQAEAAPLMWSPKTGVHGKQKATQTGLRSRRTVARYREWNCELLGAAN